MRVLGIETSTTSASIAIVSPENTVSKTYVIGERRSTDLLVGIDELCVQLGIAPREVEAVAVGAGPGSFTGLRIGMATAKGIAFAAQRPLWSVSSLAVLAVAERKPAVCAVLDARRGEVFAGCYRGATLVGEERVMNPAELVAWAESQLGADVAFAGDALDKYPELSPLAARWTVATPSSIVVAELALAGPRTDVLTSGAPMYIRASEAEIRYPDGVPGALRKR